MFSVQVVRSLLNARAHPALPDNTADRCTPIHYAIRRFDLDAPFRLDTADILNAILHQACRVIVLYVELLV
jgi:hypothetical protein